MSTPSIFLSWAHGGEAPERRKNNVLRLANLLAQEGFVVDLDLYEQDNPDVDWTRWGPSKVKESDFVLCILSKEWNERWEGSNRPTEGAGAVAEADALNSIFSTNQAEFRRKVKLIILPDGESVTPPLRLHGIPRFQPADLTSEGIEDIVRMFSNQPKFRKPESLRRSIRKLPPHSDHLDENLTAPETAIIRLCQAITRSSQYQRAQWIPADKASQVHQNPPIRIELDHLSTRQQPLSVEKGRTSAASGTTPTGSTNWRPNLIHWKKVLLVSSPGMGKSWLLSHYAENAAQRLAENPTDKHLSAPILLPCESLALHSTENVTRKSAPRILTQALSSTPSFIDLFPSEEELFDIISLLWSDRRITLCLDGFDELVAKDALWVRRFLELAAYTGNAFIVTSRPWVAESLIERLSAAKLTILPFSTASVRSFIAQWFPSNTSIRAKLIQRVESGGPWATLLTNPLMLRFTCTLTEAGHTISNLPTSQFGLISALTKTILEGKLSQHLPLPESPHTSQDRANERIQILSSSLARLTKDRRATAVRFDPSNLEDSLKGLSSYTQLANVAKARWQQWHFQSGLSQSQIPPDEILVWEFIHDGYLTHVHSDEGGRIQFTHPLLQAFCLAHSLSKLDASDKAESIEKHLWFDGNWSEAVPFAIALSPEKGEIIEYLRELPRDHWHMRRETLVRALCAAPEEFCPSDKKLIIQGLKDMANSPNRVDHDQATRCIEMILIETSAEFNEVASELLSHNNLSDLQKMRILAALLASGDSLHKDAAIKILRNRPLPSKLSANIFNALVSIKGLESPREILSLLLARLPDEKEASLFISELSMHDQEIYIPACDLIASTIEPNYWAKHMARALATAQCPLLQGLIETLANSKTIPIALRLECLDVIFLAGYEGVLPHINSILDEPGAPEDLRIKCWASQLSTQFIFDHRTEYILLSGSAPWELRKEIAKLAASNAPSRTRNLANRNLDHWIKIRLLVALIDVNDDWAIRVAEEWLNRPAVTTSIKVRLYDALCRVNHLGRTAMENAYGVAMEAGSDDWASNSLVIELARGGGLSFLNPFLSLMHQRHFRCIAKLVVL